MWLREEEFDDILARYWEHIEDEKATHSVSVHAEKRSRGFLSKLGRRLRSLLHGSGSRPLMPGHRNV